MNRDAILLTRQWDGMNSSLSKQAKDSRRVRVAGKRSRTTTTINEFAIFVDDKFTFHASTTLTATRLPCAWVLLKVSETRYAGFWLYQETSTDLKLERLAYALSTWYHDSRETEGPRPVVAYFATQMEIRTHQNWHTLYAKHPLVRFCGEEHTFSRSKRTNIEWGSANVQNILLALYRRVAPIAGKKVQFESIV